MMRYSFGASRANIFCKTPHAAAYKSFIYGCSFTNLCITEHCSLWISIQWEVTQWCQRYSKDSFSHFKKWEILFEHTWYIMSLTITQLINNINIHDIIKRLIWIISQILLYWIILVGRSLISLQFLIVFDNFLYQLNCSDICLPK